MASFFSLVTELEALLGQLNTILAGADDETVQVNGVTKDSISKIISDRFTELQSMINGRITKETLDELTVFGEPLNGELAEVWNDSVIENNGLYGWHDGAWIPSNYDPKVYANKLLDLVNVIAGSVKAKEKYTSYRDATEYAWHIIDSLGRVGLGLHKNGSVEFGEVINNVPKVTRDFVGLLWSIKDSEGRAAFGVRSDGSVHFNEAFSNITDVRKRELGNRFVWSIKDEYGNAALGIDEKGFLHGAPSPSFIANLLDKQFIPSENFSTLYNAINVRDLLDFKVATIQESDKAVFDVRKIGPDDSATALIEHQKPLLFIPVSGQSNSTNTGPGGVLFADEKYPHSCMTYSHSSTISGANIADENSFIDLTPISDKNSPGQRPATLASFALENLIREKTGLPSPGMLAFTPFDSGKPIEYFVRGTNTFSNISISTRKSKDVAKKYGRDVECKFFTFIQGETESEDYENTLIGLASDIKNEIATQLEQPYLPEFVILQINVAESRNYDSGIAQAQLDAAFDSSNGIILAGPMYDAPVDDGIHQNALGRMVIAQKLAVCYQSIIETGEFIPLWPLNTVLNGRNVDITFSEPGEGLEIDDDWMSPVPNFGFTYADDSDSAEIESVSIVSNNTVRVTLTEEPTGGNRTIKYAVINETDVDGWTNGRGQLYAKTRIKSLYHSLGFPLPEMFRHYCVRFAKEF